LLVGGAPAEMIMGPNGFNKSHVPFEKTGYNGTTPPPFGMAGLPSGNQPGCPPQAMYPFVLPQPHQSQLLQHHVMPQVTTLSIIGAEIVKMKSYIINL